MNPSPNPLLACSGLRASEGYEVLDRRQKGHKSRSPPSQGQGQRCPPQRHPPQRQPPLHLLRAEDSPEKSAQNSAKINSAQTRNCRGTNSTFFTLERVAVFFILSLSTKCLPFSSSHLNSFFFHLDIFFTFNFSWTKSVLR